MFNFELVMSEHTQTHALTCQAITCQNKLDDWGSLSLSLMLLTTGLYGSEWFTPISDANGNFLHREISSKIVN